MNITVVGSGYVGLVCGAGFSEMGNHVICIDSDKNKIDLLNNGSIPIFEPGLQEVIKHNLSLGSLKFTTDLKAGLDRSNLCFIAVGTPQGEDGRADLSNVLDVAKSIGRLVEKDLYVINKSTVPIGTAALVKQTIYNELRLRNKDLKIEVISNPEFLREGAALTDFLRPDRVVIGSDSDEAIAVMKQLYARFTIRNNNLIIMDIKSAEMTKYAANALLATKISFMNEIANICERVKADVNLVRLGVGSDSRIGYSYIYPGCGYGGSCFPKDVQALVHTAKEHGYNPILIESVEIVNQNQKLVLVDKVTKRFENQISNLTLGIWGLSFKPETDDMREAPSVLIINELTKLGATFKVYDPKSSPIAKKYYLKDNLSIEYHTSKYDALKDVDALLLITEWKEFSSPDFEEMKKLMKQPIIFDGRNQYNKNLMHGFGFEYFQIGV
ncbi:MAG: UDP-glucose/GDP-mannose dehydrogenase family protein [Deltaproteobacteria bacterium]|jgi:UDPglucose 6-dehydrogenase|nr:UDP-glucose/GDP-mannose dehydrogenase family protein [Deltaproteobacteria bacterium]